MEFAEAALPDYVASKDFSWAALNGQLRVIGQYVKKFGNLNFIWKTGFDNLGGPKRPGFLFLDFFLQGADLNSLFLLRGSDSISVFSCHPLFSPSLKFFHLKI